jgi:CO/xanthine dehydrogenase FAD-binding subunit
MKRQARTGVERRRRLVEINLISEKSRIRGQVRRTGCSRLLLGAAVALGAIAGAWAGLH